jgi:alkylhydroperoxidase/carboxymuconolactone decarboxylase family protein YurZ
MGVAEMCDYKEQLRRLAVHDDALVSELLGARNTSKRSTVDARTEALVQLAATIAADGAPASFQCVVDHALAAGATTDEIVATLEALTPVTGSVRVVGCAPKLALALGYDVEAALE